MILQIPVEIDGKAYKAVLDTGSTYNYINDSIVQEHNLVTNLTTESTAQLIDGSEIITNEETCFLLKFLNDSSTRYKTAAKILKKMEPDLILGMEFLLKNEANINLQNMSVVLDSVVYELEDKNGISEYDKKIEDKSKIYTQDVIKLPDCIKEKIKYNETQIPPIGLIPDVEHEIRLKGNEVVEMRPFRISLGLKQKVEDEIQKLLKDGIIQKSKSPYASAAFPILKKNGKIRIVVDYRALNRITIEDNYVFPKIWDILAQLNGSSIFSKLDMKSGYYQVKIKDDSRPYTAFWVENTKYEWNRMPFGLTNAPKTFQKIMDSLFSELPFVKVYLDDLVIHFENQNLHNSHLETVLQIINDNNLKVNLDKSQFFKESVLFLGHYVSKEGITVDTSPLCNFTVNKVKT
ncbi:Retrovirus-related Pol polyprotein from transposon gypsy [Dictyocoela muelleri]|nr:Retrovirus-related Pol polyprotein from transposon gypsy [Dictyocoela muelleri]